jgi:hypothetical protein
MRDFYAIQKQLYAAPQIEKRIDSAIDLAVQADQWPAHCTRGDAPLDVVHAVLQRYQSRGWDVRWDGALIIVARPKAPPDKVDLEDTFTTFSELFGSLFSRPQVPDDDHTA